VGFLGKEHIEGTAVKSFMFTGVQVFDREIYKYMSGKPKVFSVTRDLLPDMLEDNVWVHAVIYGGYWMDVGTHERLAQACAAIQQGQEFF